MAEATFSKKHILKHSKTVSLVCVCACFCVCAPAHRCLCILCVFV